MESHIFFPDPTAPPTRRDRRDLPPCPGCPRPEKRESAREAPRDRGGLAAPEVTRAEAGQRRERRERPGRAALRRRREAALRRRPARSASGERVRRARVGFPRRERSIGRAGTRGPAGLSMPGVKLTTQAYCKMVLHGAKYPHCAVNGLLVAEKQKPRKEHLPLGGPGAHHTLFVDCIPLFHGTLALAPMLEVALTLVSGGGGGAVPAVHRERCGRRSPGRGRRPATSRSSNPRPSCKQAPRPRVGAVAVPGLLAGPPRRGHGGAGAFGGSAWQAPVPWTVRPRR
uniref:Uncharacterized protein n=1 Tax=Canis lupus familiaris TaxID=9615 RepID=A0A8C0SLR8_CANLF